MGVGDGLVEVGAEVEVATIITIMVAMRQSTQARCTRSNRRHHIATGAVDFLMTTNMDLPRTPLGHRHHLINTGRDTDRVVPGRTHRNPRTAETLLTQMVAAETHRERCLARIIGADITLDPRVEAVTVGVAAAAAAAAEEEEDTMLVVVVGVVMVMVMEITEEEEDSEMPRRTRAATILVSMMVATAQAAVDRHEGAVEVEVTESFANVRTGERPLLLLSLSFSLIICCFLYAYFWFRIFRNQNSWNFACHPLVRHVILIQPDIGKTPSSLYRSMISKGTKCTNLDYTLVRFLVSYPQKKNKWKYSCAQSAGTCTTLHYVSAFRPPRSVCGSVARGDAS